MKTKVVWTFVVSIAMYFYKAFVVMNLWNWFATAAFHASSLSYWETLGLTLLLQTFLEKSDQTSERNWKLLFVVLDYCIPEDRMEAVRQVVSEHQDTMWYELAFSIFGTLVSNSAVLGIGYLIHTLA